MPLSIQELTEMPLKLRLTSQAQRQLEERASRSGLDVAAYASELLEQAVAKPKIDDILGPFRQQVADSGMSQLELEEFYEGLRDEAWVERRDGKA